MVIDKDAIDKNASEAVDIHLKYCTCPDVCCRGEIRGWAKRCPVWSELDKLVSKKETTVKSLREYSKKWETKLDDQKE